MHDFVHQQYNSQEHYRNPKPQTLNPLLETMRDSQAPYPKIGPLLSIPPLEP